MLLTLYNYIPGDMVHTFVSAFIVCVLLFVVILELYTRLMD